MSSLGPLGPSRRYRFSVEQVFVRELLSRRDLTMRLSARGYELGHIIHVADIIAETLRLRLNREATIAEVVDDLMSYKELQ